jgi:hypothetical protein
MIIGAVLWAAIDCFLYWTSRRRARRFLAALPPGGTGRLPDPRGFGGFGLLSYTLAEGRLLGTPTGDPAIEPIRLSALRWRHWWPVIGLPFVPVALVVGLYLKNSIGISLDSVDFRYQDLRVAILAITAIGAAGYAIKWRGPRRRIATAVALLIVAVAAARIAGAW